MPIKATAKTFDTRPGGAYPCLVNRVFVETRPDYNNPKKNSPCITWQFVPKSDLEASNDPNEWKLFEVQTGMNFGSNKAMLTKIVNGLAGRALTVEEVQASDLEKFVGTNCTLIVTEETDDSGDKYNKIMQVTRDEKRPFDIKSIEG